MRHIASHRILVSLSFGRGVESSVPVAFDLTLSVEPQCIATFKGRETSLPFLPLSFTLNENHKTVLSC